MFYPISHYGGEKDRKVWKTVTMRDLVSLSQIEPPEIDPELRRSLLMWPHYNGCKYTALGYTRNIAATMILVSTFSASKWLSCKSDLRALQAWSLLQGLKTHHHSRTLPFHQGAQDRYSRLDWLLTEGRKEASSSFDSMFTGRYQPVKQPKKKKRLVWQCALEGRRGIGV